MKPIILALVLTIGFIPQHAQASLGEPGNHYETYKPVKQIVLKDLQPLSPLPIIPQTYADVIGQNTYRDYIFSVESRDDLTSVNYLGCYGLGQDCNNWLETGRLDSPVCPDWRTNLDCQLRYWDWYANTVYGGWANSYSFRSTHNYW